LELVKPKWLGDSAVIGQSNPETIVPSIDPIVSQTLQIVKTIGDNRSTLVLVEMGNDWGQSFYRLLIRD
jgi:hypothetical protein